MSGHEARINDALKQLGEEFRLGMVAAEEYRARRRLLLASWGEQDATTSPGNRRTSTATTTPPTPPAPKAAAPGAGSRTWIIAAAVAAVLAVAGVLYLVLAPSSPSTPDAAAPSAAPPSPQVQEIKKAADDFLAGNRWEQGPIDAFLAQWRALPPEDRARALDEPSLRTLKYQLEQNIHAETQLVPANATPEQRQRLDMLTRFAHELGA